MKTIKKTVGLMIVIAMMLSMVSMMSVHASLPGLEQNIKAVNFGLSYGNWGGNGSASTLTDDKMGKVYRWTTKGDSTTFGVNMQWFFDETKRDDMSFKAGDKLYMSYYYRVNDTTTDASSVATPDWVAMAQRFWGVWEKTTNIYHSSTEGLNATGEWMRYEGIVEFGWDRTWYESAMWLRGQTSAAEKISIDFAGMQCIWLGAAADEGDTTVLQQVQNSFSNDSTATISLAGKELTFDQDNIANVVGSPNSLKDTLVVTPNDPNATYTILALPNDNMCLVTVYSAKANLIDPSASNYTEYYIMCEQPVVTIPVNEGKGIQGKYRDFYKMEGPDPEKEVVDDPTFGKVYRYRSEYTEAAKWPKLDVVFDVPEVNTWETDYVYFSFYLRVNSPTTDPKADDHVDYIVHSSKEGELISSTPTINMNKEDGSLVLDEWRRVEYIVPVGAMKTATTLGAKFQYGVGTRYGAKVSFDIAVPECYYLGGVTYYDGATEEDFQTATISKLKETFGDSRKFEFLRAAGQTIALDGAATEWTVAGSVDKIYNTLQYTTEDPGAYVVASKGETAVDIKVYAHTCEDMTNPKGLCEYAAYTITPDILVDGYTITCDNAPVADYGAMTAGAYQVKFNIANQAARDFKGTAFLAVYDESGKLLLAADSAPFDTTAGSGTPQEITLDATLTTQPHSFKIYLFDSSSKPMLSVTTIGANGIVE